MPPCSVEIFILGPNGVDMLAYFSRFEAFVCICCSEVCFAGGPVIAWLIFQMLIAASPPLTASEQPLACRGTRTLHSWNFAFSFWFDGNSYAYRTACRA